jgi:hypothetical protein
MSSPNLSPLPKPYDLIVVLIKGGELSEVPVWDADQMRAYGEARAAAEREACARLVERANVRGAGMFREDLAALIRTPPAVKDG